MIFEAVKAKHGDALILRTDDATILIDGGARGVYKRFLAARLEELDAARGHRTDPLVLDLVMVSHIDSDHIAGVLDLTKKIRAADQDRARPPATIREAWVNTFSDAILEAGIETSDDDAPTRAASVASTFEELGLPLSTGAHNPLKLASVGQGRLLQERLKTLRVPINEHFNERIAMAGAADKPRMFGDLSLKVIGPTMAEIDALREAWKKELPKVLAREAKKKAKEAAAAVLDRSVYNIASIVVIAEQNGKRILLTGDARGDMIETWLDRAGLTGKQHFDILKMPHHGATGNVSTAFFTRVTADHYVVSGDGNHDNPEPEMFEMLFTARGDADYKIHMTYSPGRIKAHRKFHKHAEMDAVLSADPWRKTKLVWPKPGTKRLEITL